MVWACGLVSVSIISNVQQSMVNLTLHTPHQICWSLELVKLSSSTFRWQRTQIDYSIAIANDDSNKKEGVHNALKAIPGKRHMEAAVGDVYDRDYNTKY